MAALLARLSQLPLPVQRGPTALRPGYDGVSSSTLCTHQPGWLEISSREASHLRALHFCGAREREVRSAAWRAVHGEPAHPAW
jgi:hypothetical protein